MKYITKEQIQELENARWAVAYTTIDEDITTLLSGIKIPVFGCSSFQGVFTPEGFQRGIHFLVSHDEDGIDVHTVLETTTLENAQDKARNAANEIIKQLGNVDVFLLHATLGYEDKIVEAIDSVTDSKIPIYGGTAGDDDFTGKWFVFRNHEIVNEGFLLAGFRSKGKVLGSFVSGYVPTEIKGKVTKAEGRMLYEIDGKPAAVVYNEWLKGAIQNFLETGGNIVLEEVSLHPLGRVVDTVAGVKVYLLSYPYTVIKETKALYVLTEFKEGDEVILMSGSKQALIQRGRQVIEKALSFQQPKDVLGAINIYCAGCVGVIIDNIHLLIKEYNYALKKTPFVGAATFSEQGCFIGQKKQNRHGNLMADTIIFSK